MTFNFFVLPFILGLIYLLITIIGRFNGWIRSLEKEDRIRFRLGFRSRKSLSALKEVFLESLVHRRMFRRNALLGYMHMTFALGWFLLIVMGNMESRIYSGWWVNPPYYPIFLKFFIHDKRVLPFEIFTVPGFFRFSMDLLLMLILSGLILAFIKRQRSRWFGLKKNATLQLTDKVAMTCLWLIFPMRLLAESFTAGAYGYGGGFVTQHLGNVLAALWPFSDKLIAYGFWWLYSFSLGIFFVTLPYSRYMHIPAEVLLIFFRNFGIKSTKVYSSFSDVEVFSCPGCGVCIDVCQLTPAVPLSRMQSIYFIRSVRNQHLSQEMAMKCLMCGRCREVCPVGIDTDSLRLMQRTKFVRNQAANFSYLPSGGSRKAEVLYFAGCMTHLTPGIIKSMKHILREAKVDFLFLDEDKTICCGRPLMLSGKETQACELMEANKRLIHASSAKMLVSSCPICVRTFREDYNLDIEVLHHSQYLLQLIKKGKIPIQSYFKKVVYHDPCELGRGMGIYNEPRELLGKVADVIAIQEEKDLSMCCGGSLGILNIDSFQRDLVTRETMKNLLSGDPEALITACPLCKKTLAKYCPVKVLDIAEMVHSSIPSISGKKTKVHHIGTIEHNRKYK
jgi:Fe-S oxidoreductase